MTGKIVGFRVTFVDDGLRITALKASQRGTPYMYRGVTVKTKGVSREVQRGNVEAAIQSLTSVS